MNKTYIKFIKAPYKDWVEKNPVIIDGAIVFVTNIPWYRSWFGLKPTGMKLGDGVTKFNKLKFI